MRTDTYYRNQSKSGQGGQYESPEYKNIMERCRLRALSYSQPKSAPTPTHKHDLSIIKKCYCVKISKVLKKKWSLSRKLILTISEKWLNTTNEKDFFKMVDTANKWVNQKYFDGKTYESIKKQDEQDKKAASNIKNIFEVGKTYQDNRGRLMSVIARTPCTLTFCEVVHIKKRFCEIKKKIKVRKDLEKNSEYALGCAVYYATNHNTEAEPVNNKNYSECLAWW